VQEDLVLRIETLSKRFPGVQALDSVCLQVRKGEVHAVVGENGAGKSTLMKILAGAETPDQGNIYVNGHEINNFDPQSARRMGVGIIFQEFNLIAHFSAAKNIALGRESHRIGWISNKNEINSATKWLNEIEASVPAHALVQHLSVGQQQQIEIAKAISQDAAILIMDEPASALSADERRHLFRLIDKLRQNAITVLYVSHSLDEIFRVADRVTVLKDGQLIFTKPIQQTNADDLITAMVGRQLDRVYPPKAQNIGNTLLSVKSLCSGEKLRDVSFELRKGEILGIYGLVGAGRTDLCKALFGVISATGELTLNEEKLLNRNPSMAIKNKMAFLTEDRKTEGLIMGLSLRENMALPSLSKRASLGIIKHREERREIRDSCQKLKIKTPSIENDVYYLSGGNQQKVVIGKWLLSAPLILICDEPTRGVDVGAKMEIYSHLRELADQGLSIILVSSELPEIIGMSDRILVMREGKVACELDAAGATEEKILAAGLSESAATKFETPTLRGNSENHETLLTKLNVLRNRLIQTDLVVFLTLVCLVVVGIFTSESFLNKYNLTSIVRHAAGLGIVSMGQAVVMISGGLDISVGSMISLTTIVAALLMNGSDAMIPAAAMACLGAGLIVGFLNGFAVVKLKIVC